MLNWTSSGQPRSSAGRRAGAATMPPPWAPRADDARIAAIYQRIFTRALQHFFPGTQVTIVEPGDPSASFPTLIAIDVPEAAPGRLAFGISRAFTRSEQLLVQCASRVAAARFASAGQPDQDGGEIRRTIEDQTVAEFVCGACSLSASADAVADVLGVLRTASVSTYENRRITTGVLLEAGADPGASRARPDEAVRYSHALTTSKTFFQLCDGIRTVAVLDSGGYLVGLTDIRAGVGAPLPYPTAERFAAHAAATAGGRRLCAILTANGEIKLFANGVEAFAFARGRWHLSDVAAKHESAEHAIGRAEVARRLLGAAMNLADQRRGGLFVVLDDEADAGVLVSAEDRLDAAGPAEPARPSKQSFHYLLRGSNAVMLAPTVLETYAAIDGAVVLRRDGTIVAVAAILRSDETARFVEGARTAAAMFASRYGTVIKISEDGLVSLLTRSQTIWTL